MAVTESTTEVQIAHNRKIMRCPKNDSFSGRPVGFSSLLIQPVGTRGGFPTCVYLLYIIWKCITSGEVGNQKCLKYTESRPQKYL